MQSNERVGRDGPESVGRAVNVIVVDPMVHFARGMVNRCRDEERPPGATWLLREAEGLRSDVRRRGGRGWAVAMGAVDGNPVARFVCSFVRLVVDKRCGGVRVL